MKKIIFLINGEKYWIFIDRKKILKILNFAGSYEKDRYIFVNRIKDTNEFKCSHITIPSKFDYSSYEKVKISLWHKIKSRIIKWKNPYWYEIGFWHTYPTNYGCEPSQYDLQEFSKKSKKYKISFFLIATKSKIKYLIYSFEKKLRMEMKILFSVLTTLLASIIISIIKPLKQYFIKFLDQN